MERGSLTYQYGLPGALDAIDSQKERRGIRIIGMSGLVLLQSLEDERNTVLRLVIDYLGHLFHSFLYVLGDNGDFVVNSSINVDNMRGLV
jgi:hypothetical protein